MLTISKFSILTIIPNAIYKLAIYHIYEEIQLSKDKKKDRKVDIKPPSKKTSYEYISRKSQIIFICQNRLKVSKTYVDNSEIIINNLKFQR